MAVQSFMVRVVVRTFLRTRTFWHLSHICELLVCYLRGKTYMRHPGLLQIHTWIEPFPPEMGIGRLVESLPVVLIALDAAVDEVFVRDERNEKVLKILPYSKYSRVRMVSKVVSD